MIDLHSHTTASDGQYPPSELLRRAASAGVTTLAVTDHDTVSGLEASQAAAKAHGIRLVPGIELSAFIHRREIHVLGHFIDPTEPRLGGFSTLLRKERQMRMEQMVEKMKKLGFPVSMEQVLAIAGDAHLGRPHLARLLVQQHWCLDTKEAFDRFLGDGKPGWVERYRVTGEEAIDLIRGAGGAATVAHPAVSKVDKADLVALKAAGLAGLEVGHADQGPEQRKKFADLARELDLIPTAGSDFHGEAVAPDRMLGSASMDPACFEALEQRALRSNP